MVPLDKAMTMDSNAKLLRAAKHSRAPNYRIVS